MELDSGFDTPPNNGLKLNKTTYIIGGVLVLVVVMFLAKSKGASSTPSQGLAEPNTNVVLGSLQQLLLDSNSKTSQAIAMTQQDIATAKADIVNGQAEIGKGQKAASDWLQSGTEWSIWQTVLGNAAREEGKTQAQYLAAHPEFAKIMQDSAGRVSQTYDDYAAHFAESPAGTSVTA